jgi:hypothetical protein
LVGALALAATAAAKGPSEAKITGKGLGSVIVFRGDGESNTGSGLGAFAEQAGYWPEVFRQTPDPTLRSRPNGKLGPKLTVTYVVPGNGGRRLHQDLYPWATPVPLSYMRPGQPIFGETTHGGWYQAPNQLKTLLVKGGLPAAPPAAGSDGGGLSTAAVAGIASGIAALLLAALSVFLRRRPGAAEAT